jgi:N-acetylmuramoyl-L-alanine amidase
LPAGAGAIRQVRVANQPDGAVRVVLDLAVRAEPRGVMRRASGSTANRLVVDLVSEQAAAEPAGPVQAANAKPGTTTVDVERTAMPVADPLVRPVPADVQTRLPGTGARAQAILNPAGRDIVIAVDAGHGGKDPGAHGPHGVLEKDVTLGIARRLVDAINAERGMRGVLTRDRDEFIPLRGRTERARKAQADLFVSIHADAVRNRDIQGASIYVLNEKGATDEAARQLAARENAADLLGGVSLRDKDPMLRSVLLDLSQNASLSSSIEVADEILDEVARIGSVRKRQVMQAPFMVLKAPDVPSVLIETAYISNPEEERRLDDSEYRGRLAGAILAGLRDYFYKNPPSGTLVAEISRQRLADAAQHVNSRSETLAAMANRNNGGASRER